ncbi:MAG TPA: lipid-A-disaccharide synthase [Rhizomicrobium sp.]|nr:lipid-A-disaccharide synthase [Rhizomicrobium sp.]
MPPVERHPLDLMLVCGEPSGDLIGAQLMAGLKAIAGNRVRFSGVGGAAMEAQGLRSLYPLDATAVMGLREVVPRIPAILGRVREAADFALSTRPDAVVLIDSPDFTHRIAQRLKRLDPSIRTVNYVAPQVWASRAYRARKMADYFDLVLALLPFEAPFFERYGLRSVFVGHPAIERAAKIRGGAEFRAKYGIASGAPLLAVLPGSRTNEIRFILPVFREAVAQTSRAVPGIVCALATVPHVAGRVRAATREWPTPLHIVEGEADKFACFDAVDVALAASGTVTTELALARKPMVVGYRAGWLTYLLALPLMNVRYITLVNILLDREAAPEFLQARCTPSNLAHAVTNLFLDGAARARQIADLDEATRLLGLGGEAPSLRAARAILDFVGAQRSASGT